MSLETEVSQRVAGLSCPCWEDPGPPEMAQPQVPDEDIAELSESLQSHAREER